MTASARSSRESSPTSCSCRGTRCSTSPRWPTPSSLCRAAGYTGQKGSAMSSQARTTIVDGLLFDGVSPLRAEATIVVEGENIMSITGPSAAEPGPADADSLATKDRQSPFWRFAARASGLAYGLALAVRPAGAAEVSGAQGWVPKIVSAKRLETIFGCP